MTHGHTGAGASELAAMGKNVRGRGGLGKSGVIGVGVLIGCVIAARLAVHLLHTFSPGVDAGYYPLLSRRILESGSVLVGDLPLRFVIDAGLARVLMMLGMGIDEAVVLAAKVWDAMLPPLAAIPIAAWALRAGRGPGVAGVLWPVLAAVAIGIASFPIVRMLGDFQKNALGMVWFAGLVWASGEVARVWMGGGAEGEAAGERGRLWRGAAVMGLMLVLVAATHVGASAACAVYVACLVPFLITGRRAWTAGRLLASSGAVFGAGVLAFGVMYALDSKRAMGLAAAPLTLLQGENERGPRLGDPSSLALFALSAWAAWLVWSLRRAEANATRDGAAAPAPTQDAGVWAVTFACVGTALVLSFPPLSAAFSGRLSLMVPLPLAFAAGTVLRRRSELAQATNTGTVRARLAPGVVFVAALLSGVLALPGATRAMVDDRATAELRSLRAMVSNPARTLLAAPHGEEFWAGFVLRVDVRHTAVPAAAFDLYDEVLLLQPVRGMGPPERGPRAARGGGGPAGGEPPERRGPGGFEVPAGATPVFKGEHYTLYRLERPGSGGEVFR